MALFEATQDLVNEAEELGLQLAEAELKAHQLRRVYEKVQYIYERAQNAERLSQTDIAELQLLKPWLAYAASRKPQLKGLQQRLKDLIDEVGDSPDKLKELYRFVQSILAYHKSYER
ncbi:type III-A CRISPR-associated protein Csm2 [Dehalococcoidia bacterium]|nr:type III-A CRISPR-associated protein Csm2 [Dehalococcoidia bacterium]